MEKKHFCRIFENYKNVHEIKVTYVLHYHSKTTFGSQLMYLRLCT